MKLRGFIILTCFFIINVAAEPSYELLPEGSIYIVNTTDHDIVFSLIDNERLVPSKLPKGDYTLYRILGPDQDNVYISVVTGEKSVKYKLLSEGRYLLYWNHAEERYDVGVAKR
jgi:hypothetical protein